MIKYLQIIKANLTEGAIENGKVYMWGGGYIRTLYFST